MEGDEAVEKYSKMVEEWNKSGKARKEKIVPIAERAAKANLTEITSINNQSPEFVDNLKKHSPRWGKWIFTALLIIILFYILGDVLFIIFVH